MLGLLSVRLDGWGCMKLRAPNQLNVAFRRCLINPASFSHSSPPALIREEAPESFHHELENVAWEESLRGCAENTYLVLFEVGAGPGWVAPLRCWAAPVCSVAIHAFTMRSCATYTTQPVPHIAHPTTGQP